MLHRADLHQIAERQDKKGYPTPVNAWLAARNGQLARQILLAPGARIHEYCEPRGLARLIEMHLRGINKMTGYHLYRLMSAEIWLQRCIGTHPDEAEHAMDLQTLSREAVRPIEPDTACRSVTPICRPSALISSLGRRKPTDTDVEDMKSSMLRFNAFLAAQRAALKALLGRLPAIGAPYASFEQKLLHNFHELDDLERPRYYAEVRPKMTDDQRFFFEGECRLIGQMYAAERRALYELVRQRKPRLCIEIGTWSGGGSTFFISSALKANRDGTLVTFEIGKLLHSAAQRFYSECLPDLAPLVSFELGDANPKRVKEMALEKGPIEFAFLDGAENAEESVTQFFTIRPHFAPGAVVACHDWETTKMEKLKPILNSHAEWQMLCRLRQPESVGFAAFQLMPL